MPGNSKQSVTTLGIVACGMLEDELAHVLSIDDCLKHLILIDSSEIQGLKVKLDTRNRSHLVMSRESVHEHLEGIRKRKKRSNRFSVAIRNKIGFSFFSSVRSSGGAEAVVVVDLLRKALHSDEKLLKEEVYRSIRRMAEISDGILLFFGLCGNALADIADDFRQLACPLYFLADVDGKRIDDCIAVALGGNKEYARVLNSYPGVGIYFTPMWAYHWQGIDREARKSSASRSRGLGSMLRDLGYSKVARLDTGLEFISDFEVESKINDFAEGHKLEVIHIDGGPELAERCYRQARENLADANWKRI
jgi:hypothetical protein